MCKQVTTINSCDWLWCTDRALSRVNASHAPSMPPHHLCFFTWMKALSHVCSLGHRHSWGPMGWLYFCRPIGHNSQPLILPLLHPCLWWPQMCLPEAGFHMSPWLSQASHHALPFTRKSHRILDFRVPVLLVMESNHSSTSLDRKAHQLQDLG